MQLTIDPNDDLNDVLRVVAALYDVRLEVVDNEAAESGAVSESAASAETETAEPAGQGEAAEAETDESEESTAAEPEEPARGRGRRGRGAGRAAAPRRRRGGGADVDTAAVRSWARENGYQVSDRGRISSQIVDAYLAAQG